MGDPGRVREWLSTVKLERYYDQFIANGYDDLDTLEDLTEEDLDAIGVTLAGHRKRLLMKANSYAGVNFHASSGSTNSPQKAHQSAEQIPITPSSQTQPSAALTVDSLDDVLGELQAFSAGVTGLNSSQIDSAPATGVANEGDVDLDALLDDLNKFDPSLKRETGNSKAVPPLPVKEAPVPRLPRPVQKPTAAASPQPEPEPEPDVVAYQQIGGPTVKPVDQPPELPARGSAVEARSDTSQHKGPAVSNGGVHQVGTSLVHPPNPVVPEAQQVHLTGKPMVVHNSRETQAVTVEIKERMERVRQELEHTSLSEKQKESRLREEKMKIAMEKIKEASVQQAFIGVYNTTGSCQTVTVIEGMVAMTVCYVLMERNNSDMSKHWVLVEQLPDIGIERTVEDHEVVLDIYQSWPRDSENRFVFREDPLKYDLFEHPIRYFPAHLGMQAGDTKTGSAKAERAKAILLKEFFTSSGRVPELEGNLFYKEQGDKKTWKKAYFMLRSSGIYYSTKGKSRESRNLVCFVNFEGNNLYMGIDFKKQFKAPNNFCFALKPAAKLPGSAMKELRCLCSEDQETMLSWTAGIRLAKFGLQLRDNYQAIQRKHNKLKELQQERQETSGPLIERRATTTASAPATLEPRPVSRSHTTTDRPQHGTGSMPVAAASPTVFRAVPVDHRRSPEPDSHMPPLLPSPRERASLSPSRARSPKPRYKRPEGPHLSQPWFFGALGREEAVEILLKHGNATGMFLVRESSNCPGAFVLTMAHDSRPRHFQIQQRSLDPLMYSIDDGPMFSDVVQVIEHYSSDPDRLPCKLLKPCARPTYRKIGD